MKTKLRYIGCLIVVLITIANTAFAQNLRTSKRVESQKEAVKSRLKDTIPSNDYQLSLDKIDCIVKRRSDSSKFIPETNVVEMYGNARIEYCDMILEADQINYNTKTQIAEAFGERDTLGQVIKYATFTDGSEELQYDHFTFNFVTQKGKVDQLVTQQGEGVVRAEVVKKISEDESFAKNMIYTTCNLERPHYHFTLQQAKYKTDKYAAGRNVNLYIKDIPTPLYLPFAIFPREQGKRAGFTRLAPGYDQTRGFSLRNLGWYQPINDHMDAELTTNIYTTGSLDVNTRFQYYKRYRNRQNLNFSYSRLKNLDVNPSQALGVDLNNSFQLNYTYNQDPKVWPLANLNANISLGQSNYKRINDYNPNQRLNNTYTSSVSYNQRFRKLPLNLSSSLRYNQNTQSNAVSVTLPSVNLSMNTIYPFRGLAKSSKSPLSTVTLNYSSNFNNELKTVDSVFFQNPINTFDEFKYNVKHSIGTGANFKVLKYLNFSPGISYNEAWVSETQRQEWDSVAGPVVSDRVKGFQTARWYTTSLGFNTTFYGTKKFKGGTQLRHVMRPNIGLNYTPDFSKNDNYFGTVQSDDFGNTTRYPFFSSYGPPAVGGGSISFSLNNNIEMKTKDKKASTLDSLVFKKIKIFESLNLNTNYNLKADSLKLAPVTFSGNTRLFDKFSVNVSGSMNPYSVNKETGRRVDEFFWKNNKGLLDVTNASFRLSGNVRSKPRENQNNSAQAQLIQNPLFPNEQIFVDNYMNPYVDFSNPWDLGFNYYLGYNKSYSANDVTNTNLQHTIRGNFNFNLTDNWKVSGSTGYDFERGEINYPNFNIHRDLHCWQMNFNWSPNKTFGRYMFSISPKSSMLQDLKLEKRRTVYDNFRN